jgi:Tripartite tricarboxylate transporter family receptor
MVNSFPVVSFASRIVARRAALRQPSLRSKSSTHDFNVTHSPGYPPSPPRDRRSCAGRITAGKLSESLGQSFIVENRPGAGGVLGSELVARATPDGYTLLVSGVASHAVAPALSPKFPFDPVKDFAHIALFGGPPSVLAVHPSLPSRDLKSFIAARKGT